MTIFISHVDADVGDPAIVIFNADSDDEAWYAIGRDKPNYPVPATLGFVLITSCVVAVLANTPRQAKFWYNNS